MKNIMSRKWFGFAALLGCSVLTSSVVAQSFPAHEVNMIVNYGAGGTTDVATRALAQTMEKILGKSIVVQNKPGALGTLTPSLHRTPKARWLSGGCCDVFDCCDHAAPDGFNLQHERF